MESVGFFANEPWSEQLIDLIETFSAGRNDVSVWELKVFLLVVFRRRLGLNVVVYADVAQFLFDVTNKPPLHSSRESIRVQ